MSIINSRADILAKSVFGVPDDWECTATSLDTVFSAASEEHLVDLFMSPGDDVRLYLFNDEEEEEEEEVDFGRLEMLDESRDLRRAIGREFRFCTAPAGFVYLVFSSPDRSQHTLLMVEQKALHGTE